MIIDTDLFQQRLKAWPEPISPFIYGAVFIIFAIIFLPVGTQTLSYANNVCYFFDESFPNPND
jgi:hypothetical protein